MMSPQVSDIPPATVNWIVVALCGVIATMAGYFVRVSEQQRKDSKEEREILITLVKENTKAFTSLTEVVEGLQHTITNYIQEEH